jgi:hypothetical protein
MARFFLNLAGFGWVYLGWSGFTSGLVGFYPELAGFFPRLIGLDGFGGVGVGIQWIRFISNIFEKTWPRSVVGP